MSLQATCTVLKGAAAIDSTRLNSANSGGLEVLGRVCGSANNNNNNKSCETGDDVPSLALAQRSDALVWALCTAFVGYALWLVSKLLPSFTFENYISILFTARPRLYV